MQYTLSNGKDRVYQWDKKIVLTITEPEDVPVVHFKWGGKAAPFEVKDQQVKIPPELMQQPHDIVFWAYTPDHTMDMAKIKLEQRPKPADYVYTPTEIKTWEQLDERIEALEKGGGIAGVSSVNGQTGAVEITAKGLGALTNDDLQGATDKALAQAKSSGEFDGAPGAPGTPGNDGYSPTVTVEQTDTGATITATDKTGTTTATVKNGSPGAPGTNGTTPHIGDNGNWYLGETDTGKPSRGPAGAGLDVTGATVGQIVKIAAVDDNGVPTAWVPVDMAAEKNRELLTHITLPEAVRTVDLSTDSNNDAFACSEIVIRGLASCNKTALQPISAYINNTPVIGSLKILKNSGYWGYWELRFRVIDGYIDAICRYNDACVADHKISPSTGYYSTVNGVFASNTPVVTAESIQAIKLQCSNSDDVFKAESEFWVYGVRI